MASITSIIEDFIIQMMDESDNINLSRNELAQYFSCAPSQINYVLSTRFGVEKGYIVDSRRGGGGYITLIRIKPTKENVISNIAKEIDNGGVNYFKACQIVDGLVNGGMLNKKEANIVKSAVSDKALLSPVGNKDILRGNILKNIVLNLNIE